jgi:hypothetical protein
MINSLTPPSETDRWELISESLKLNRLPGSGSGFSFMFNFLDFRPVDGLKGYFVHNVSFE